MKKTLLSAVLCISLLSQSCYKEKNIIPNLAPSDFSVEATPSPDRIELNWTEAMDPEETQVTYDIRINGILVARNLNAFTYAFENLEFDTEYLFNVIARDENGIPNQVNVEVRTDAAPIPSEFEPVQSGKTAHNITVSWNAPTAGDGSEIVYDIYLDGLRVASDISETEYTFEGLKAISYHSAKVVAQTRYGTSLSRTLEVHTDGNHVRFGVANRPMGQAMSESDYGIIELPVIVRDFKDLNTSNALEDIHFGFSISGNVNEQDYELLTPSPMTIAEGSAMGIIKIRVIADDFQEFPFEYLIIEPDFVENGRYSGELTTGTANVYPQFVIEGLDHHWLQEAPDAYSVAISWSNNDANVNAVLYRETTTPGVFSSAATFDTGEQPERFELSTSRADGNYYLELVRNDNITEPVEVSVYVTAPEDPDRSVPHLVTVKRA
jgi:hypothetical protein